MTPTKALVLIIGLVALSACRTPKGVAQQPVIAAENSNPPSVAIQAELPKAFTTNQPQATGSLQHPELKEVSGLASSTRRSNVLWAINDSGNTAKLYALNHLGESLATFKVAVKNRDWEDMASAWINGESYLLIGDIGDNLLSKDEHAIYIIAEPLLDNKSMAALVPIHTLRFRYPNQSHNAESLAFADGWVYVLTKESPRDGNRRASQVYRIPLDFANSDHLHVAQHVSSLAIPPNSIEASLIASLSGVDISQPTAFDIDSQNRHAYILTYRNVYRYTREANQSWADVLAQPRIRVHTHSLSQAESLAVSGNGVVWFTSEKLPAPLWALPSAD